MTGPCKYRGVECYPENTGGCTNSQKTCSIALRLSFEERKSPRIIYNGRETTGGELQDFSEGTYIVSPKKINPAGGRVESGRGEQIVGAQLLISRIEKLAAEGLDEVHVLGPIKIMGEEQ